MAFYLFLSVLVGGSIVLQGSLNREHSNQLGLLTTVFLNALVFLAFSFALWLLAKLQLVNLSQELGAGPFRSLGITHLIPGICGLIIVLATPWAIMKLGSTTTFGIVIASQLIFALVWDSIKNHSTPSLVTVLGAVLVGSGALILLQSSK